MAPARGDRPVQPSQPPRGIMRMWLRWGQGCEDNRIFMLRRPGNLPSASSHAPTPREAA
jgi:hypothetical protein